MAFVFSDKYVKSFVTEADLSAINGEVVSAHKTLCDKTGAGNDFLGWLKLPVAEGSVLDGMSLMELGKLKAKVGTKVQKYLEVEGTPVKMPITLINGVNEGKTVVIVLE